MISVDPGAQHKNSKCRMARTAIRLWFLLLVSGFALPLFAQEIALGGRVIDPDGNALAKASVQLIDRGRVLRQTTSGPDGLFQIALPSAGQFVIRVDVSGFRPVEQPVSVALSDHSEVTVKMAQLSVQTENVSVTAD